MRISDWSSDVCSSDLAEVTGRADLREDLGRPPFLVIHALCERIQLGLREAVGVAEDFEFVVGKAGKRLHHARTIGIATGVRSEEHTSELQSLMRISYAVFWLKKKNKQKKTNTHVL